MRILILTTVMAPYRVNLFNELAKYCKLAVCFEQQTDVSRNNNWYEKKINNFEFIALKKWDRSIKTVKFDVLNYLHKNKYDLAISYEYSTNTAMLFMFICKLKNIPYLINCDGGLINSDPIKDKVKRFFIKRATACLASGEHAKQYFVHYGAKEENIYYHNFSTLYEKDISSNVINNEDKKILKEKLNIIGKKTVIAVGRFIPLKKFDILIKAWKNVSSDCQLLIIGGGDEKSNYEILINDLSLANVKLIDFISKEDLKNYYRASDLFVLPTESDVWGLVINEAMACGLPVITTDKCVAGLELVKDNENGFIIPVNDEVSLAEKINVILNNNELSARMSYNNLKKIREYTIENIATKHIETIKKVQGVN